MINCRGSSWSRPCFTFWWYRALGPGGREDDDEEEGEESSLCDVDVEKCEAFEVVVIVVLEFGIRPDPVLCSA